MKKVILLSMLFNVTLFATEVDPFQQLSERGAAIAKREHQLCQQLAAEMKNLKTIAGAFAQIAEDRALLGSDIQTYFATLTPQDQAQEIVQQLEKYVSEAKLEQHQSNANILQTICKIINATYGYEVEE